GFMLMELNNSLLSEMQKHCKDKSEVGTETWVAIVNSLVEELEAIEEGNQSEISEQYRLWPLQSPFLADQLEDLFEQMKPEEAEEVLQQQYNRLLSQLSEIGSLIKSCLQLASVEALNKLKDSIASLDLQNGISKALMECLWPAFLPTSLSPKHLNFEDQKAMTLLKKLKRQ